MTRKQNKSGVFSEYQWEIINFVKDHQGMRYRDILTLKGWPTSTISGTILAYERQTGERIGIVGTKPRKDRQEPSLAQKRIIAHLLTHMDSTLSECADELDVNISYVSMTAREYVPERHRARRKKYKVGPVLPGSDDAKFTIITCLRCDLPFPSRDPKANRLCRSCNGYAEDHYSETYTVRL